MAKRLSTLRAVFVFVLTLFLISGGQIYTASAAGFQTLSSNDLTIGVWYPSDAPEQDERLGPFDVRLAFDAPPKSDGQYQFILLSHGNSGYFRNYYLTGKALADAGFIVVAPMHAADHLMKGKDFPKVLDWRIRELQFALEAVLQIESFRRIADLSRVHAIGHSLGAVTALTAAGAGFDISLLFQHCSQNDDPGVCTPRSDAKREESRISRGIVTPDLERDIALRHFPLAFVNGGVAVVAPVGQLVFFDERTFRAQGLFIVGLEDDKITLPQFHASYLAEIFPERYIRHFSIRPGNHFAFIGPLAERVADDIPELKDPPGFDRKVFVDKINQDLVDFFVAQSQKP